MGFRKIFSRFRRDESGAIVVWVGLSMPMILGIGALAFDMNSMYVTKAQLQYTADAAAMAAAQALPDQSAAATAAQNYAGLNMPAVTHGNVVTSSDVEPGNWDPGTRTFTAGGNPTNAVRVSARRDQQNGNPIHTLLASTLGISSVDISVSSIAAQSSSGLGGACILALNNTAPAAFHLNGTAVVRTSYCNIQVNSCDSTEAILASGLTLVEIEANTGDIKVCGEVKEDGPAIISPTPDEDPAHHIADPFASMPFPNDACDHTTLQTFSGNGGVENIPSGVYCAGLTINGNGTANFEGNYIIKGGPLYVAGTRDVTTGTNGATFFASGAAAQINFEGTADTGLMGSTGGLYASFLFFTDNAAPSTTTHILRGTTLGGYDGKMYFPGAKVTMTGTADPTLGSSDCAILVADTFEFAGTPFFQAADACSSFPGGGGASGVATIVQ